MEPSERQLMATNYYKVALTRVWRIVYHELQEPLPFVCSGAV